jgi:hypothetical protein
MYGRAAQELEGLLTKFPQARVKETRAKVAEYMKSGGVQFDVKDLSTLQKGIAIATGKAVPSDFTPKEKEFNNSTQGTTGSSHGSMPPSNPFAEERSVPVAVPLSSASAAVPPPAPSMPPPPPPPAAAGAGAGKKHLVVGLYDHEVV